MCQPDLRDFSKLILNLPLVYEAIKSKIFILCWIEISLINFLTSNVYLLPDSIKDARFTTMLEIIQSNKVHIQNLEISMGSLQSQLNSVKSQLDQIQHTLQDVLQALQNQHK